MQICVYLVISGSVSVSSYELFSVALYYYILFCYYLLEACTFLIRDRKRDPEGRGGGGELAGVGGGKIVFRLYCMRKESMNNKRGNIF